ncbi:TPA: hypothetical protein ACGO0F_001500 [Streptococcus suis]
MQLVISRQYQQYLREIGIDIKELLTSSGIERELVDGRSLCPFWNVISLSGDLTSR